MRMKRRAIVKKIALALLGVVIVLAASFLWCSSPWWPRPYEVGFVAPSEYAGGKWSFVIRECKINGIEPNWKALEKHGDWYWEFRETNDVLYVKDIRPILNAREIWAGWAHVAPIDSFQWEKDRARREVRCSLNEPPLD